MSSSGTITISYSGGGVTKTDTITKSSTGRVQWEETVAGSATDAQILCPTIDESAVVLLYIKSTQDVLIETNTINAVGGDAITLKANEPYVWWTAAPFVSMLTTDIDVNGVYVTVSGATPAVVTFEAILDTTP